MKIEEIKVRRVTFKNIADILWLIPSGYKGMVIKVWEDETYYCGMDWMHEGEVEELLKKQKEFDNA